jgi:DNA polymerase-3 subunit epsilon
MKINKPIVFFDIETTGLDIQKDRIIEIATIKYDVDGSSEEKKYRFNPQIPISKEASEVHGITNDMLKDCPYFVQYAKSLSEYMYGCDIGGYNSDFFDFPFLIKEMERSGVEDFPNWELNLIDVYKYEKYLNSNKLGEVYKRYTGKILEGSHDALNDIRATIEILFHQTKNNKDITPEEIDLLCQSDKKRFDVNQKLYINKDGVVCWSIGKFAHKPFDYDLKYLNWVLNSDFPKETKQKLNELIKNKQ